MTHFAYLCLILCYIIHLIKYTSQWKSILSMVFVVSSKCFDFNSKTDTSVKLTLIESHCWNYCDG